MHSSAAAVCISCEPGQYQDGANVIDVNNDNMHSASSCKKCPIGWSTKDQTEVKLPGALENRKKHLKSTCVRCLRGKHTNGESGAAQCDVCPPGSFGKLMTEIDSPGFSCVKWYVKYTFLYIYFLKQLKQRTLTYFSGSSLATVLLGSFSKSRWRFQRKALTALIN